LGGGSYRRLTLDNENPTRLKPGADIDAGFILTWQPLMRRAFPEGETNPGFRKLPGGSFIMDLLTVI
jgi:hypothetical protein